MKNKWGWGGVNAEVNPCGTCHNPHKTTKDYPCSLPSSHSNTWEIWGDGIGEKMVDYLGAEEVYQPPYKVGKTTYERNAVTQPNYVELCLECHQYKQTSYYYDERYGKAVSAINWGVDGDKHGKKPAEFGGYPLLSPYQISNKGKYVLCCTDCHEPHGSPNEFLLRTEVNGRIGISTEPLNPEYYDQGQWEDLCDSCHPEAEGLSMFGPCGIINGCHDHGSGDF